MPVPRGEDVYLMTQPAAGQALANGGRSYGGGTVMMVAVPTAPKKPGLSAGQAVLGVGAAGALAYLWWKGHKHGRRG